MSLQNKWKDVSGIGIIVVGILLLVMLVEYKSNATDIRQQADFANLVNQLSNEDVTILFEFISPVAGQNAWFVPEDLEVDNQFAGKRLLGDTGNDYICIDEIGLGSQTVYCVPLSNIASISFYSP